MPGPCLLRHMDLRRVPHRARTQIWLIEALLRRLGRAHLWPHRAIQLFLGVANRHIDGTSQVFRVVAYLRWDTSIDFFCPGSFVGNPVLVLSAERGLFL